MELDLKTSLGSIVDLCMPRSCVVCSRSLNLSEDNICIPCLADLPLTRYEEFQRNPMAERFNALLALRRRERPLGRREDYVRASSLFFYTADYCNITPSLKYGRNFAAGSFFAGMLGQRLSLSSLFSDVDRLIPVPLHWSRLLSRGYNQAEIIARELARSLPRAEVDTRSLRRRRPTRSQTGLGSAGRLDNVKNAFAATPPPGGSHILLVDDVFTGGSTLCECYMALRDAAPADVRISVATLAFAQ